MPSSTNTVPAIESGALQQVEKLALQMGEKALEVQSQQAAKLVQDAQQAQQAYQTVGNMLNSSSNPAMEPLFGGNSQPNEDFHATQQKALQAAKSLGVLANIGCRVTINGEEHSMFSTLSLKEESDAHHSFTITYDHDVSSSAESISMEDILGFVGSVCSIVFLAKNIPNAPRHPFQGVVTKVYKQYDANPYGTVVVEGFSTTYLLDDERTKTMHSWHQINIADIVNELTSPLRAFQTNVVVNPRNVTSLEWYCQYKQTPYATIKKMAYDFGEFFYYDGLSLIYGRPDKTDSIEMRHGFDYDNLRIGFDLRAVGHSHLVYNSATNEKNIKQAPDSLAGLRGYSEIVYKKSKEAFTSPAIMPAPFRASRGNLLDVAVKSHTASEAAKMYKVSGKTRRHDLKIGNAIVLHTPRVDGGFAVSQEITGQFIVTKLWHSIQGLGDYICEFEGIPANMPMLPMGNIEVPVAEPQTATVFDNKDPAHQNRVRVKFPWNQNGDMGVSDWLKILTPDGGGSSAVATNRGFMSIPEVGDTCMIGFRFNDPMQPFLMGNMHPGTKAGGGGFNNNIKSFTSKSGHTLHMDDGGGITIKDKSGHNLIFIDGNSQINIVSSKKININSEEINLTASKDINLNAGNSINLNAQPGAKGGGEGTLSISTKKAISATSDTDNITFTATTQNINLSTPAGITGLNAKNVTIASANTTDISGTTKTHITGGEVEINKS